MGPCGSPAVWPRLWVFWESLKQSLNSSVAVGFFQVSDTNQSPVTHCHYPWELQKICILKALGCPACFYYSFVTQPVQVWALLPERIELPACEGLSTRHPCLSYVVPGSSQILISENEISIFILVELLPSLPQVLLLRWVRLCVVCYNELRLLSVGKRSSERSLITTMLVFNPYFISLNGWCM